MRSVSYEEGKKNIFKDSKEKKEFFLCINMLFREFFRISEAFIDKYGEEEYLKHLPEDVKEYIEKLIDEEDNNLSH